MLEYVIYNLTIFFAIENKNALSFYWIRVHIEIDWICHTVACMHYKHWYNRNIFQQFRLSPFTYLALAAKQKKNDAENHSFQFLLFCFFPQELICSRVGFKECPRSRKDPCRYSGCPRIALYFGPTRQNRQELGKQSGPPKVEIWDQIITPIRLSVWKSLFLRGH